MEESCIDLADLGRLFKGERLRVTQWNQLYLEESPTYFTLLSDSLAAGDTNGLASAAHDLRPQAHYLGSERMLQLLVAVEERARMEGAASCRMPVEELLELSTSINVELLAMTRSTT